MGFKKVLISSLHHIALFAMLHTTFIAPSQTMLADYFGIGSKNYYKLDSGESKYSPLNEELNVTTHRPEKAVEKLNKLHVNTILPISTVQADLKLGIIGVSLETPIDNPSDNIFTVFLERAPVANETVYLNYELYGVSDMISVARSINSRQSNGGYVIKKNKEWSHQSEEIDNSWLNSGRNTILFTLPEGAAHQYKIRNLSVEIRKSNTISPKLVLHKSFTQLTKDNKAYIKGFVRNVGKDLKVYADGTSVNVIDGEFECTVDLSKKTENNKFLVVTASDATGLVGQELVFFDNLREADELFEVEKPLQAAKGHFTACVPALLNVDGAYIAANDSSLVDNYEISIQELRKIDIAPMESGMINVTKGGKAYRFLPDGAHFEEPVTIGIEYDTLLIPSGYSSKDIRTYFFDTYSKRWIAVKKDSVDVKKHLIISGTTHFTDYINGIIQVPESPETGAFMPTMMSDIKAADPSANLTIISPPQASQKGSANLGYPINIPSGRNGMQPQLSLHYSNDGGNGWLGQGWSLAVPAITLDTRWGVPTFDPAKESEIYLLSGEQLMYPDGYMPNRHQDAANNTITTVMPNRNSGGTKLFHPRKQGSFEKIERLGSTPSTYHWKVTDANGTISYYGGKESALDAYTLKNGDQKIVHWALYSVEDVYGNNIRYDYDKGTLTGLQGIDANLNGGTYFYLKNIYYTGYGDEVGNYKVSFVMQPGRQDVSINAKLGYKHIDPYLLSRIDISYAGDAFRTYNLYYGTGRFGKSRLTTVSESDGNSHGNTYSHTFEYYDDVRKEEAVIYFSQGIDVNICNDDYEPCQDSDGDGVCNENDQCPTERGPAENNGCPVKKCLRVVVPLPVSNAIYQYEMDSPHYWHEGNYNCEYRPVRIKDFVLGATTYTASDLYLTHYTTSGLTNLCAGINPVYSTATRNTNFNDSAQSWFQSSVLTAPGISGIDVQNKSYLNVRNGLKITDSYYTLKFLSDDPDLDMSCRLEYLNMDVSQNPITWTTNISHFTKSIHSASGAPVLIKVNGILLSPNPYDLYGNLNAFIQDFRQAYGQQADIVISGDQLAIDMGQTTSDVQVIQVGGIDYSFEDCGNSDRVGNFGSDYKNYFRSMAGGNFEFTFNSSVPIDDSECPDFLNTEFIFSGYIPSYNTAGAILGSSKSKSISGGGYVGVGIGGNMFTKMTTFGVQLNWGQSRSESLTAAVDINGDGLDDIVMKEGNTLYYKAHQVDITYDQENEPVVEHSFGPKKRITGMGDFYRSYTSSKSRNFQITGGFSSFGGFIGRDKSESRSETDIYFTDGNGDGLPDIVKDGVVYFNMLDVNGNPKFVSNSKDTENMVITAAPREIELPDAESEITYPGYDVVKVWEAPADGAIKISNNISLADISQSATVTIEMQKRPQCFTTSFPLPRVTIRNFNLGHNPGDNNAAWDLMGQRQFFRSGTNWPNVSLELTYQIGGSYYGGGIYYPPLNSTPPLYMSNGNIYGRTYNGLTYDDLINTGASYAIQSSDFLTRVVSLFNGLINDYPGSYYSPPSNSSNYDYVAFQNALGAGCNPQPKVSVDEVRFTAFLLTSNPNIESIWIKQNFTSDTPNVQQCYSSGPPNSTREARSEETVEPLLTDIFINGIEIPISPLALYDEDDFEDFQDYMESTYPGAEIALNEVTNTITINVNVAYETLQTITFQPVNNPAYPPVTYNFSDCGTQLAREAEDNDSKISEEWQSYRSSKKELEIIYKKFIAKGGALIHKSAHSITPPVVVMVDNNITYSFVIKEEGDYLFYDSDWNIVSDRSLIVKLSDHVTAEKVEIYREIEGHYKKMIDGRIQAQADAQLWLENYYAEHRRQKEVKRSAYRINPQTCEPKAYDMCLLFGAMLNQNSPLVANVLTTSSSDCVSSTDELRVRKGDRIYFRVHNNEVGTPNPIVNWNPKVEYTDPVKAAMADASGLKPFSSSYSDGFVLSSSQAVIFPGKTGTALITWPSITVKQNDIVKYEIYRRVARISNSTTAAPIVTQDATPLFTYTCTAYENANTPASIVPAGNLTVNVTPPTGVPNYSHTEFYFVVTAKSNVDWKLIEWKPKMECTVVQQVIGDNNTSEGDLTSVQTIYPIPDYSIYKPFICGKPYVKMNVAFLGSSGLIIQPNLSGIFGPGDNGKINFVVKKGTFYKNFKQITVTNGSVTTAAQFTLSSTNGTTADLEIIFSVDDSSNLGLSLLKKLSQATNPLVKITGIPSMPDGYMVPNSKLNLLHKVNSKMGHFYRQWGQFMYNPDAVTGAASSPYGDLIKEEALEVDEAMLTQIQTAISNINNMSPNQTQEQIDQFIDDFEAANSNIVNSMAMMPAKPFRNEEGGVYDDRWTGFHSENYATPAGYRAGDLLESVQGLEGDNFLVQSVLQTGAFAISKCTDGNSKNTSGGVSIYGGSIGGNKSKNGINNQTRDYTDFNGDRYPDIVSQQKIQYTTPTGGLYTSKNRSGNLSISESDNQGMSASGSFGKAGESSGDKKGTGSGFQRFEGFRGNSGAGISGSFSEGNTETITSWVDINGDGLSDFLKRENNQLKVSLNYGGATPVNNGNWGNGHVFESEYEGFSAGIGVNRWNGSAEAGVTLAKSVNDTENTLIDINSDGLIDYVGTEGGINVQLNVGNKFLNSEEWTGLYDLGRESESVNASINLGFTIAAVWGFWGISFKIPAVNTNGVIDGVSTNRTKKSIVDYDGDGYPDLIEEIGNNTIKVYSSTIRRTDMLKSVVNPLGGKFTVDYKVVTPTYDNPNAKWVMTDVIIEDGYDYEGDGFDVYRKHYEYENGRYDRREREFYGFGTVKDIDYRVDEEGVPTEVYRTTVTKYHNRSYFLNGMMKESYTIKGNDDGSLFSKTVDTYVIKPLIGDGLADMDTNVPLTYDTGGREGRRGAVALLTKTQTYWYDLSQQPITTEVEMTYDTFGRVTEYLNKVTSDPADDYRTVIQYHDGDIVSKNILHVPMQVEVFSVATGEMMRKRTTEADSSFGHITKIMVVLNDQENAVTDMKYDDYGNLNVIEYPENANAERMRYDYTYDGVENKYIVEIKDAFGYSSSAEYDYHFDKPLSIKDLAGNIISYKYDYFGRVTDIRAPKEYAAGVPYTINFTYCLTAAALPDGQNCFVEQEDFIPLAITKHYDPQHPGNDIETITLMDGLGRAVQLKKDIQLNIGTPENPLDEEFMSVSGIVSYDEFGRVVKQSHPTYEKKSCVVNFIFNDYETGIFSTVSYDELDRPKKNTDEDQNMVTTEYGIELDGFGIPTAKTRIVANQTSGVQIINETFKDITGKVTSIKNVLSNAQDPNIWTKFNYNAMGEMVSHTDAREISTTYSYDFAGRKIEINHPDNGKATYDYDMAGNLEKLQTANLLANTNLQPENRFIKYSYEYNRPTRILFPDTPAGDNIANVNYDYGGPGSGNNTGKLIHQADATGEQYFSYGDMGEMTLNIRTVVGPNIPTRTFTTAFKYDSWNRVQEITYPDQETVTYNYNLGGNLSEISGVVGGDGYKYVSRIDYDHYEQRKFMLYGNNAQTSYEYSGGVRRLHHLEVKSATDEAIFSNMYSYDNVGNITGIQNSAGPNSTNLMGGTYSNIYKYDSLNRLKESGGSFSGDSHLDTYLASYHLIMEYDATYGITKKAQEHARNQNIVQANTYSNDYTYYPENHKLKDIVDLNTGNVEAYEYDHNGNTTAININNDGSDKRFFWDESNRLRVVEIGEEIAHHSIYDAAGERILKATSHVEALYENGTIISSTVSLQPYTTYPNPYIVVESDGEYSKHYYDGARRVVSRIGESTAEIFETTPQPRMNVAQDGGQEKFSEEKLRQVQINDITEILQKARKGSPKFRKYEPAGKAQPEGIDTEAGDAQAAEGASRRGPTSGNMYFYHPDHLGTSTYLTDANGQPYQFFLNLPFGETMAEQHTGSEDYATPFKFNGKELDEETGLYYYGARYFDPRTSVWLNVDPLAIYNPVMESEYYGDGQHNGGIYNSGNLNPYIYCYANPVNYLDPNGKQVYFMTPPTDRPDRNLMSASTDFTPLIGDIKGIIEGIIGKDMAGNELSITDRALSLILLTEVRAIKNAEKTVKAVNTIRKITKPLWGNKISDYGTTAMEHIKKGHFFDAANGKGKSMFLQSLSNPGKIKELVGEAVTHGIHSGTGENYKVIHTFEKAIGTTSDGKKTKTLLVYLDSSGNVKNAYPIPKPTQ